MRTLVLGAGKMVEAILMGLKKGESLKEWGIYSPSGTSAQKLAQAVGAQFIPDLSAIKDPERVMVGCKPQQLKELAKSLDHRFKGALYLSLLAAIEEKTQLEVLGARRLVRVMPNLSVRFNQGVTLLSSTSAAEELPQLEVLFGKLGSARAMDEKSLEELTLLTGSGPALFYEFTRGLAGCFSSLDEAQREAMARQVLLGAGISASEEVAPLGSMIDAVTSKGGVTIAVLNEWRGRGFVQFLKEGITAGKKRTEELKKIILQN